MSEFGRYTTLAATAAHLAAGGAVRDEMKGVAGSLAELRRDAAFLRCTVAAVACERYRLRAGRFPDSLDAVVAARLPPAVPRDPFDHGPVRFARQGGRVVVYSVGTDGRDDGGRLDVYRVDSSGVVDWGVTLLPLAQRGRFASLEAPP